MGLAETRMTGHKEAGKGWEVLKGKEQEDNSDPPSPPCLKVFFAWPCQVVLKGNESCN